MQDRLIDLLLLPDLYLARWLPRRPRLINGQSSKLAYIDPSYHEKTKSSAFLLEYLRQFLDVEVILDDRWRGLPLPDLSFIDESYRAVMFFQTQPNGALLKQIRNDNILFVPMYDSDWSQGYKFWRTLRRIKILNFSRTLDDRLRKWGLQTMYVQYFPEPAEFLPGQQDEVFFWQRVAALNINVLAELFQIEDVKIHIHKAVDPYEAFVEPSPQDEERFGISYSDWFETRDGLWDVMREKGIYIAPRVREGIGMSFLEAMAMGKAVVAVGQPTMNEYIEHGRTGYLFELDRPEKLDLANVADVQRNAYEYIARGYALWQEEKKKIMEWVDCE